MRGDGAAKTQEPIRKALPKMDLASRQNIFAAENRGDNCALEILSSSPSILVLVSWRRSIASNGSDST